MNRKLLLVISVFQLFSVSAFSQGSLTPPGPPAASMKTLDQLDAKLSTIDSKSEKRVAIDAAHVSGDATDMFVISQPGSYFLPSNVSSTKSTTIYVTASNVTIDLNGFAITGASGSIDVAASAVGCRIRNGSLNGSVSVETPGAFGGSSPPAGLLQDVTVTGYITAGYGWVIDHCTVYSGNIYVFDGSVVTNCTVYQSSGPAFLLGHGASAVNCAAVRAATGFDVGDGARIYHCTADYCTTGFRIAGAGTRLEGNSCSNSSSIGYDIEGSENYVDGNVSTDNTTGFKAGKGGNLIIRNSTKGGSVPFSVVAGNSVGHITDVWNNANGADITTANAWANFEY